MTGSMSASPGYICLCIVILQQRQQVYTESKNKERTDSYWTERQRGESQLPFVLHHAADFTSLSSSKSCWQAIIEGDGQHRWVWTSASVRLKISIIIGKVCKEMNITNSNLDGIHETLRIQRRSNQHLQNRLYIEKLLIIPVLMLHGTLLCFGSKLNWHSHKT